LLRPHLPFQLNIGHSPALSKWAGKLQARCRCSACAMQQEVTRSTTSMLLHCCGEFVLRCSSAARAAGHCQGLHGRHYVIPASSQSPAKADFQGRNRRRRHHFPSATSCLKQRTKQSRVSGENGQARPCCPCVRLPFPAVGRACSLCVSDGLRPSGSLSIRPCAGCWSLTTAC
jgi:hypothetical protein